MTSYLQSIKLRKRYFESISISWQRDRLRLWNFRLGINSVHKCTNSFQIHKAAKFDRENEIIQ